MLGQAIADGILTGAIIALGAIGVSFGLQILRFANFAHSELLTWAAIWRSWWWLSPGRERRPARSPSAGNCSRRW